MADDVILHFKETGYFYTGVKGESYYQDHLRFIYDEFYEPDATLILDDSIEQDKNAVEVQIDGDTVGYLSRTDAKHYRKKLKEFGYPEAQGICKAKFIGGYVKDDGTQASIGVVLDLSLDWLKIEEVEISEDEPPTEITNDTKLDDNFEKYDNEDEVSTAVEKTINPSEQKVNSKTTGCRNLNFMFLGIILLCGLVFIGSAVFSKIKLPASPDFQKWTSEDVVAQFQAAGLETGASVSLISDDFNMFVRKTDDATFFFIPSACEGCRGRVFAYSNKTDLNLTKSYYENLAKGGKWLRSWLFVKDNILVQMPGDIPEDIARQYETVLNSMGD